MDARPVHIRSSRQVAYPSWFWNPPLGMATAVGFSPVYHNSELSIKEAVQDGIESLARMLSVRVIGERISIGSQQAEKFKKETSIEIQEKVSENYKILATYESTEMVIVLVGLTDVSLPESKLVSASQMTLPSWLSGSFTKKKKYGIGSCNRRFHQENGWKSSEQSALIDLASNVEANIQQLEKYSGAFSEKVTNTEINVQLDEVRVFSRWKNPTTGSFHVLLYISE